MTDPTETSGDRDRRRWAQEDAARAIGIIIFIFIMLILNACTAGVVWLWTLVIP